MRITENPIEISLSYIETSDEEQNKNRPTLLFIHGAESSKETWTSVIADLKDHYRIYAIDLRGHGQTPLGRIEDFTLENLVKDIHTFVIEKNLNNLIIIAHSMGNRPAICYAAKYPQTLAGYVMEEMEMLPRQKENLTSEEYSKLASFSAHQPTVDQVHEEMKKFGYSPERVNAWIQQGKIIKHEDNSYTIGINPLVSHLAKNAISASNQPQEDFKSLKEHHIPLLLLQAERDSSISSEGLRKMQDNYPEMSIKTISNSVHNIHKSAKESFLNTISSFIQNKINY